MAAITRFGGKGKVTDLHFAALTVATHAADVRCAPLTADSDLAAIAKACPALARALGELNHDQMNKADKDKRKALQGELAFPSPQLKEAFNLFDADQSGAIDPLVHAQVRRLRLPAAPARIDGGGVRERRAGGAVRAAKHRVAWRLRRVRVHQRTAYAAATGRCGGWRRPDRPRKAVE